MMASSVCVSIAGDDTPCSGRVRIELFCSEAACAVVAKMLLVLDGIFEFSVFFRLSPTLISAPHRMMTPIRWYFGIDEKSANVWFKCLVIMVLMQKNYANFLVISEIIADISKLATFMSIKSHKSGLNILFLNGL